jgi:DNA repair protein RadC
LQHFPNLEALKAAAVEELAAVPGLNRQVAEKVKERLASGDTKDFHHREPEDKDIHRNKKEESQSSH